MRPRHNKWSIVILRFINKKITRTISTPYLKYKISIGYFLLVKEENCWYNVPIAKKTKKQMNTNIHFADEEKNVFTCKEGTRTQNFVIQNTLHIHKHCQLS